MNVFQIHIQHLLIILDAKYFIFVIKISCQNIYQQFNLCNMLITTLTTNNIIDSEMDVIYN